MRRCFACIVFFALAQNSIAQPYYFHKLWDYRYGGSLNDWLASFQQTADGGYILGGSSYSGVSGDKTQDNWDTTFKSADYWLVKLDSLGQKQWDKRFGGTKNEGFRVLKQTLDGGFILGGGSTSNIGGDKSEVIWDTSFYRADFWALKIDAIGNKQWDRRFGGIDYDVINQIETANDGGYLLGGSTYSGISGDKTQSNWDNTSNSQDYWVVRIDSLGNKQWDKRFGGTNQDGLHDMKKAYDGGYILGGFSSSGVSGDKTQPSWGFGDYWIVKIDDIGNKIWDKDYGGLGDDNFNEMIKTNDSGFLMGGFGGGGTGTFTDASCTGIDYHLVKIDSVGTQIWDKAFGGSSDDYLESLYATKDGGYLIGGSSKSPISCDKSELNLGIMQVWIVKIDSLKNKEWDKTILTNAFDGQGLGLVIQCADGCYAVALSTEAGVGGYKTQPNWDVSDSTDDYWIMKFCMDTVSDLDPALSEGEGVIQAYPNPFTSDLNIYVRKENLREASFEITNALGEVVYRKEESNLADSYTKVLDLSWVASGIYFVEVTIGRKSVVKKIVKE